MNISPRAKFRLVTLGMIMGALFVSPKMVGLSDEYEGILFSGWLLVGSIAMLLTRCPQCGSPLVFQGKVAGIPIIAGFANKRCKKCGHDLTSSA